MNGNQSLLVSASELHQPFTLSQITVRAWVDNKAAFGLRGYESIYPDAHRVLNACVALVANKKLFRVGPNMFRVAPGASFSKPEKDAFLEARRHLQNGHRKLALVSVMREGGVDREMAERILSEF